MRTRSSARRWPPRWAAIGVGLVFAAAALRLLRMIDLHAVDLPYWDQYDLYQAFADGAGAWELFRWQHGPHRQGIAFLLTSWLAAWSGWNTRIEAFVVGAAILAAAAVALWLRRRLFGRLGWGDVTIPLLVLTPAQYGVFLHTPNLSHAAGPLLGLLLYCVALTLPGRRSRYATLLALDFLLIHTGFALFIGALTPLLLLLIALGERRRGERRWPLPAAAIALSFAAIALFLVGFERTPDLAAAAAVDAPLHVYVGYVGLMFANVLGLKGVSGLFAFVGATVAAVALGVACEQVLRLLRGREHPEASLAILALASFTLLYAALTAWGRLPFGLPGAQSTRYVPLVVPAFLALHLRLQQISRSDLRRALIGAAVASIALATIPMREPEARFMQLLSRGKRVWVETYLETGDTGSADAAAGLRAYPRESQTFRRVLAHMREQRLSFFARREDGSR